MTKPTTAVSTPSASAGREKGEPDLDALLRAIRRVTKNGYPSSPGTWERGADRLHALADELLPHASAQAQVASSRHLHQVIPTLKATLHNRPRPAGIEHVMVLAGQLRTVVHLLQQDPGDGVAETISRTIAMGKKGYAAGNFVSQDQLSKDFAAPRPVIQRAVNLLVHQGSLEFAGKRQLRVPVPGKPYRTVPEHIAQRLRERIASGVYRDGQALPSRRTLAKEFGCSTTAVARALADVRAEGLVAWTRGRPVTVINPRAPRRLTPIAPASNAANPPRPVQDLSLPALGAVCAEHE
ncbi:winged helix-turn-helix domain-containing protein [Streptomyces smyrnaeus]|uniref:winged helix-turn-helix domain-containing protein n=1 Tax=Streptomyces smyrnaeus TaxID=1387713 RepID=UPI0033C3F0A4